MAQPRIAFLGLGIMGGGMAGRLLQAGFPLTVYNRSVVKATPLAAAGAKVAATPREAAEGAELIFSMVGDVEASRAVWTGADGALAGVAKGAVLVECSTLTIEWIRALSALAAERGAELVDAPVTGSKGPAAAGELNFLVGGSPASVVRITPALNAMGRSVTHLGPTGSGALLKLINNFMSGVHLAVCAEALAWLQRTELDQTKAMNLILEGAPGSPMTKVVAGRMMARNFTPNFALRWMAKDLTYAIREAGAQKINLSTAVTALEQMKRGIAAGYGDEDMAGVVRAIEGRK